MKTRPLLAILAVAAAIAVACLARPRPAPAANAAAAPEQRAAQAAVRLAEERCAAPARPDVERDDAADLDRGAGAVVGRVRDAAERPVANAVVTLVCPVGESAVSTGPEGGFEFRGVPDGGFTVMAEHAPSPGACVSAVARSSLEGGETKTVDLVLRAEGGATLFGRVSCERGPLAACRVRLYSEAVAFQAGVQVRPDGSYEMGGLPAGRARVRILSGGETEVVLEEASLELAGTLEYSPRIGLDGRVALEVVVADPQGCPVRDVEVVLHRGKIAGWGTTGQDGVARFAHVASGAYVVYAKSGVARARAKVDTSSTRTIRLELR